MDSANLRHTKLNQPENPGFIATIHLIIYGTYWSWYQLTAESLAKSKSARIHLFPLGSKVISSCVKRIKWDCKQVVDKSHSTGYRKQIRLVYEPSVSIERFLCSLCQHDVLKLTLVTLITEMNDVPRVELCWWGILRLIPKGRYQGFITLCDHAPQSHFNT